MKTCPIPLLVIILLGVFALVSLLGTIWLIANKADQGSVAVVSGLCGTALGALGTILSRTSGDTQQVQVVNPPSDPVPVEEKI